jgi:hypothetical protein
MQLIRHLKLPGILTRLHPSFQSLIGIWVAQRYCSIGAFGFGKTGSASVLWSEQIDFTDYTGLHSSLQKIVKKRRLQGVPVIVSLATPDVFTAPVDKNAVETIENQEILPQGVSWDSVEYAVRKGPEPVFACIRHTDIDFWVGFFKETGLVAGSVVPSGIRWRQFVDGKGDVTFSLPAGTLVSRIEGTWKGAYFVPEAPKDKKTGLSFNAPVLPEYRWCPSYLLPALEGVLFYRQEPSFNLNPYRFSADKLYSIEKNLRQFGYSGALGLAGLFLAFLLIGVGLQIWTVNVCKNDVYNAFGKGLSTNQENARVKERLASIRSLASSKSSINRVLHDVGSIITDSIWYSEMGLSAGNGVNIVILGHSLSESAIARVIARAEGINGIKSARLEYTEKVSSDQVSRLTGGKRNDVLFRYKLVLVL